MSGTAWVAEIASLALSKVRVHGSTSARTGLPRFTPRRRVRSSDSAEVDGRGGDGHSEGRGLGGPSMFGRSARGAPKLISSTRRSVDHRLSFSAERHTRRERTEDGVEHWTVDRNGLACHSPTRLRQHTGNIAPFCRCFFALSTPGVTARRPTSRETKFLVLLERSKRRPPRGVPGRRSTGRPPSIASVSRGRYRLDSYLCRCSGRAIS